MDEQKSILVRRLPYKKEVFKALRMFNPLERLVFFVAVIVATITATIILGGINNHFLVSVPASGGTLREGVVGTPRFVNPLLASTDADHDLSRLTYRGLMKKDGEGNLVADLAESYEISDDGLTYTFVLSDATFHDKTTITAEDVLFTVKSAQDTLLKSPERIKWTGVSAKAIDEKTVTFTLKEAFAPFLESTTIGIMPKHVWENIPYESWTYSDHNTKNVIGSGMYKLDSVSVGSSGIPDYYELVLDKKNNDTALIEKIIVRFYANESALISGYTSGQIDTLGGISPENAELLAKRGARVYASPLPRVFALFFNQNEAKIFADISVRRAIREAINKETVVSEVLRGYGRAIDEPLPDAHLISVKTKDDASENATVARGILEKAGWKLGEDGIYAKSISKNETRRLSFEIATNNAPELKSAVDLIVQDLRTAGIEAVAKVYETGSLNQDIIRPRKFQSLFFGEVVETQSDLFAFWHSSQRNDPGLNISGYANAKTDKALETALATLDTEKRMKLYDQFEAEINTDVPAVFVYSPAFIYAVRPSIDGISLGRIAKPEDRFNGISTWYLETDRVWKIFAKKKLVSTS